LTPDEEKKGQEFEKILRKRLSKARGKQPERRGALLLTLLRHHGPLNKYGICQHLVPHVGSEPTILYLVDEMEQSGQITVVSTVKKVQGTKPSKYYGLSLRGFSWIMREYLEAVTKAKEEKKDTRVWGIKTPPEEFIRGVVERHRHLMPPLLDLWPAFVEAGLEATAVECLHLACVTHGSAGETYQTFSLADFEVPSGVEVEIRRSFGEPSEDEEKDEANYDHALSLLTEPEVFKKVLGNETLRAVCMRMLKRSIQTYGQVAEEMGRHHKESKERLNVLEQKSVAA
jgi:hypothetical protein